MICDEGLTIWDGVLLTAASLWARSAAAGCPPCWQSPAWSAWIPPRRSCGVSLPPVICTIITRGQTQDRGEKNLGGVCAWGENEPNREEKRWMGGWGWKRATWFGWCESCQKVKRGAANCCKTTGKKWVKNNKNNWYPSAALVCNKSSILDTMIGPLFKIYRWQNVVLLNRLISCRYFR